MEKETMQQQVGRSVIALNPRGKGLQEAGRIVAVAGRMFTVELATLSKGGNTRRINVLPRQIVSWLDGPAPEDGGDARQAWLAEAGREFRWRYGLEPSEWADAAENHRPWERGETPREYAEWTAQKYGLDRVGGHTGPCWF